MKKLVKLKLPKMLKRIEMSKKYKKVKSSRKLFMKNAIAMNPMHRIQSL